MTRNIAWLLVVMATSWMGDHRRDWTDAMERELEAARDEGRELIFALGCVLTALRTLFLDERARIACAGRMLAVGVLVPVGASLVTASLFGSSFPTLADMSASGQLVHPHQVVAVTEGNRFAMPGLTMVTVALAAGHLRAAWAILDRDWHGVAFAGRACAAITVTLAAFASVIFPGDTRACGQALVLAWEGMAVWSLARWHDSLAPVSA